MKVVQVPPLTDIKAAPFSSTSTLLQFLYRRLSLQFKKRVRYDSRQRVASSRLRVKGRFVPLSELESTGDADVAVLAGDQ